MLLIEAGNIKKYFGERLILDIKNLKIYSEDRIGVVGLNGMGKTTLINILCKKLIPDEGWVNAYEAYSYIGQLEEAETKEVKKETASKFGINDTWKDFMSGGEKTRFKIAEVLDENSKIIFADEPTSNLDIEGVKLLEKRFAEYEGALVVISHDREFLDKTCNKILEIENCKIRVYNGNYTDYKVQKEMERERSKFEYEQYEKDKKRLEDAIDEAKSKVKTMKKAPSRMGNSEARLHKMGNQKAKSNLDKAIKGMKSRIEHLEVKEKPKEISKIKLDALSTSELYSKILISGKNINKDFDKRVIFNNAEFSIYNGSRTALIGPNGSGKSTLIKMIINGDEAIKKASGLKVGYFSQDMDILDKELSIIENVMKDSIYDETFARIMLSRLLFKREEIYKKVSILSGGERVKVSFAKMFLQDINLLILDEPTNYLDIYSLEALEEALKDYDRTLLFVSHDRRFVSSVADNIIAIDNKKLETFQGSYDDYIEKKERKIDTSKEEIEKRIFVLQNKLSELIGRLSMPSKKDDVKELDREYKEVLKELQELKKCLVY